MDKSIIKPSLVYVSILTLSLCEFSCKQNPGHEEVPTADGYVASYNPLPLSLLNLDSASFQLTGKELQQPIMAVFFNPGCSHCKDQAEEFRNHLDELEGTTVVMIASTLLADIKSFAQSQGLLGVENFHFASANPVDAYNSYGNFNVPYIVIYSPQHQKIQEFRKVTGVEDLLPYLDFK